MPTIHSFFFFFKEINDCKCFREWNTEYFSLEVFLNLTLFISLIPGHASCSQGYTRVSCYPQSRMPSHEWMCHLKALNVEKLKLSREHRMFSAVRAIIKCLCYFRRLIFLKKKFNQFRINTVTPSGTNVSYLINQSDVSLATQRWRWTTSARRHARSYSLKAKIKTETTFVLFLINTKKHLNSCEHKLKGGRLIKEKKNLLTIWQQ